MQPDPPIDVDHARDATEALLIAITDILERTVDECTRADAIEKMPVVADYCRDVAVLADAGAIILRRSRR